jgi:hypothetical protein
MYSGCALIIPIKFGLKPPHIMYSRKYWWEQNLVVEPKIAIIARILADLNLAVWYRIPRLYTRASISSRTLDNF